MTTPRTAGCGPRSLRRLLRLGPLLLLPLAACAPGSGGGSGGEPGAGDPGGGGGGGASGPAPDLALTGLDFQPQAASAGDALHVTDVVANQGDAAADAFLVAIYLSSDPFLTAQDQLLGFRSVSGLGPGDESVGNGFLTVPATLASGTWYVGAIADDEGRIGESQEANNALVAATTLLVASAPPPDLVATQASFAPSVVEAGEQVQVEEVVQNVGSGDAGGFQVGVYLSTDATITPGDVLLGVRSVPTLGPGELSQASSLLTVPGSTAAGTWHVGVIVDLGGTVSEVDEFDNARVASGTLTVLHPPRPDLVVQSLSFSPPALDAGQGLSIQESVLNQGLVAADPFRVGIYLSADAEVDADDVLLGFRSLAGLDVGASSTSSATLTVLPDVGEGDFHVLAMADHEELLVEEIESNNVTVALGTVHVTVPPLPDLRPTAVSFAPSVVDAGGDVTVVERVRNGGTAAAGPFRVGVYLSANGVISTSDTLLGWREVGGLAIGAESEATSTYALPPGLAAGSWYVGVVSDDLDQTLELSSGNDVLLSSGLLDVIAAPDPKPDVLLEELDYSPSLVLPGGSLQVRSVVRNEGDLSAGPFTVGFHLSEDDQLDAGDRLLGERTILQLGIGFGAAQSFPYTVPADVPPGHYHVIGEADRYGVIDESDEDNNSFVAAGRVEVYVPPPPAPDLSPTAVSASTTTVAAGGSFDALDTVRNAGDLAAGAFRVAFYLSDDETVEAGDLLLGWRTVPALAAGADSSGTTQLFVPAGTAAGTWTLGAIVDDLDAVQESDEEDNTLAAAQSLEVQ